MSDKLNEVLDGLRKAYEETEAELDRLADECDPYLKIAVTRWVMKHIVDHARDGGTYRYLIYDRLGFGPEAYGPLCNDGITISNEFDLNLPDSVAAHLKIGDIDGAKKALGRCDEPGCFKRVSSGWPTKDGDYRITCSEHYEGKMKNV
jgi:hypothetical protein